MYVELHASSAFSFLDGASLPERLVERAAALGYDTIALVDNNGVYGAPRFYRAASEHGVRAIVGASLTIRAGRAGQAGQARADESSRYPPHQPDPPDHNTPPLPTCQLANSPTPWDHTEWDVTLSDGGTYIVHEERPVSRWFVDAVID